ncbi:unnamed protein product [Brassicogethes aeneus]|uniref:Uncharacterized protein n=1 Tax=Brassicogethes aeneus TaxID=1431903 RepID=A0A9P0FBH9_BRAAE|nr:unnamed protein product [Brassicogethes aeneus]
MSRMCPGKKDKVTFKKEISCDNLNEECLDRVCARCKDKKITVLDFNKHDVGTYEKWSTKKVEVMIKGEKKLCQKSVKEAIECEKQDIIQQLNQTLPNFLVHTKNIKHQYHAIDQIKKVLPLMKY